MHVLCAYRSIQNLAEMGSGKNKNCHISRGKFRKKVVPQPWKKEPAHTSQGEISSSSLEGSRIINLAQLGSFIRNVSAHSASCRQGKIMLTGEHNRESLASVLSARCSSCRLEVTFPTSPKVTGVGAGQWWECNLAAVWGQLSTGGGHAPLAETMSVFGGASDDQEVIHSY